MNLHMHRGALQRNCSGERPMCNCLVWIQLMYLTPGPLHRTLLGCGPRGALQRNCSDWGSNSARPGDLGGELCSPGKGQGVETASFSKQFLGFMTSNAWNWQNRTKMSKTMYFDCSDVVNCPQKHSEFSLGRPMCGCGNWWKLYHEFEKYVAWVAITRLKLVANQGCTKTKMFRNLCSKDRTM
jgi:hypothetical protein